MGVLWVDNDVFNYLCKAGCLQEVLQSVPYTLCTTELVQGEAEAASSVLQSAIDAMRQGAITARCAPAAGWRVESCRPVSHNMRTPSGRAGADEWRTPHQAVYR